jgi:CubicO group peptidase (beta-lactamase class C family)
MTQVQDQVQALLDDLVDSGVERGLQVAAYLGEDLVVDAWAGVADPATGRPVDGEMLFTVFSATKGITATAIHLLAERGKLDYDTPVATYWPEFGSNGKQSITVRHVLTHTAGILQMPEGVGPGDLGDWDGLCRGIAGLSPLWEPGTHTGYHALTFGWILGELARRVDGRSFARFLQEEICTPLGIADFYLGIPDAVEPRVAMLEGTPLAAQPPGPAPWPAVVAAGTLAPDLLTPQVLAPLAVPSSFLPEEEIFNRPAVRRAVIPAGGGIANARALARHYAALAYGELAGVRLLSEERIRLVSALQTEEVDIALGAPIRKGLGYWLDIDQSQRPVAGASATFGHPGHGGTFAFADPSCRFAFALTKNRITAGSDEYAMPIRVAAEVRRALGLTAHG